MFNEGEVPLPLGGEFIAYCDDAEQLSFFFDFLQANLDVAHGKVEENEDEGTRALQVGGRTVDEVSVETV
jgi:hypothetical protein